MNNVTSKFNEGDKVVILKTVSAPENTVGQQGTVFAVYKDDCSFVENQYYYEVKVNDGELWFYDEDQLRFAKEANRERSGFIDIKYFDAAMPKLEFIQGKSNWIDLRSAKDIEYKQGDFLLIPLGVAMKLRKGEEAHVIPRSSTFKNYGLIQTNSLGMIDNSYSGDNDQWFMPVLAMRDGEVKKYDRVCQFRVMDTMKDVAFNEVTKLDGEDRGGHGSTGKQ